MFVETDSVHRHFTALHRKTGTTNRVELALFIVRRSELEELLTKEVDK